MLILSSRFVFVLASFTGYIYHDLALSAINELCNFKEVLWKYIDFVLLHNKPMSKNVDIKPSGHDAPMGQPSSGTLKI